MTLHTWVEKSKQDPGAYLCVVFEIRDQAGAVLHHENTRASSRMPCALRWVSNERVRLDSSDIGTYYWQRQADGSWVKQAAEPHR